MATDDNEVRRRRWRNYWWPIVAMPKPPSQASIIPPLDVVPGAVAAYSFRKLNTAYAGPAMQVKRVSDNATQNIGFLFGSFDVASFNSFIGASSGTINIWYDQSGGGFDLAPSGTQPAVNLTGLNGFPTAVFVGGSQSMTRAATPTGAFPWSLSAVAMRTGAFTSTGGLFGSTATSAGLYFQNAVNTIEVYAGQLAANQTAADNVAHSFIGVINTTIPTTSNTVDGVTTSNLNTGGNGYTGTQIGNLGSNALIANVSEAMLWPGALTAGNITTLAANQKAYWATP